jgi:hypothetical protein
MKYVFLYILYYGGIDVGGNKTYDPNYPASKRTYSNNKKIIQFWKCSVYFKK